MANEYKIGNAIVIVKRPTLTDEERAKREDNLRTALQIFGKQSGGRTE